MKEITAVGIGLLFWLISGIRLTNIRKNEYCLKITTINRLHIQLIFAIGKEENDLRPNVRINKNTSNHLQHSSEVNIMLQEAMPSQQLNN